MYSYLQCVFVNTFLISTNILLVIKIIFKKIKNTNLKKKYFVYMQSIALKAMKYFI